MVSVLCLAFNHEKYISDALEGFVTQKTNFAYEVLIHDDASTDGTRQIIEDYARRYPHIIKPILQTENQYSKGIRITNELLLPQARGKYLAFCEGDDFWTDPEKLQHQVDFLESHPEYVACVHNSLKYNCEDDTAVVMFPRTEDCDITFEDTLYAWPRTYQTSSLVMRREPREHMPDFYYIVKGYGDWPMGIWLAINGRIRFLNKAMSTYRFHSSPHSWMAQKRDDTAMIANVVQMLKAVRPHVSGAETDCLEQAIIRREYELMEYQGNYRQMRMEPYRAVYQSESLKRKIKLYIKQYFPSAVQIFKEITGKNDE